jgi:hypothetical protein
MSPIMARLYAAQSSRCASGQQIDNAQIAYAVVSQFTSGGNIFKTTNGGTTWTNISGNLPSLPAWSFQLDATHNVYYVGMDNGVYQSTGGGTTWTRFGAGFPDAQVFQIELNTDLSVLGAATHGRGAWEILTSAAPAIKCDADGDGRSQASTCWTRGIVLRLTRP